MATKFRFNYNNQTVDFDDYYVRSDIFTQGNLWSWGRNLNGGLGDNSATSKSSPVQTIAQALNWKQVGGIGTGNGVGIKTDGTLWTWGNNASGILGDPTTIHSKSSPAQTFLSTTDWVSVGSGRKCNHMAAIRTNGSLWLWGSAIYGQLGDNSVVSKSSAVQTITASLDWAQVTLGNYSTGAIKTDGSLWVWGNGALGVLGTNDLTNRSSPVQTVAGGTDWKQISMGPYHCAAIKTDGSLWVWGYNASGNLGDNTTVNKSSPIQTVAGGTNWKQASCGGNHIGAIKTDGSLWMWGSNSSGQLGNNSTNSASSPIQTVTGGNNWKQISCGYDFTAALKTDGTIWTWGSNAYIGTPVGSLGDNTGTSRSSPIQTVMGGTNWKSLSCGHGHVLALTYIS